MKEYVQQKEKKMFIKRRTKLIRNHWRNGIAGVEDVQECGQGTESKVLASTDAVKLKSFFDRAENRKECKYTNAQADV